MNSALYHPETGYYSRGQDIFGGGGDFYTAPEISPWFGEQLANWLEPFLAATGGVIWEFGAGRGKLATTLLKTLGTKLRHYRIVELSAGLRQQQQAAISACLPVSGHDPAQVTWHDHLPDSLSGIVLANEVLDAIPVRVWRYDRNLDRQSELARVQELWLEASDAGWQEHWQDADPALTSTVLSLHERYGPWPDGYTSEWPEQGQAWLQTVTSRLRGMAVAFDYGFSSAEYFHPQRSMGTLMAHHRQRSSADIFANPGMQDITAHVNFSLAYEAIMAENAELLVFTTQAKFLLAQENRFFADLNAGSLMPADLSLAALPAPVQDQTQEAGPDPIKEQPSSKAFFQRSRDIQLLTHESEMGELFKCMIWQHGWDAYAHESCASQLDALAAIDQSYLL